MDALLTLRAPEPDDANLLYIWENSTDERHSSLRPGPVSRHRISEYIARYDGDIIGTGSLRFMIECDGETIGTIDLFDYDHRNRHAFVGIYVTPRSRRKGLGLKALKQVENIARRRLSLFALAALVSADNTPSRALFEAAGFQRAGVLDKWIADGENRYDAIIYTKAL